MNATIVLPDCNQKKYNISVTMPKMPILKCNPVSAKKNGDIFEFIEMVLGYHFGLKFEMFESNV